MYERFNELLKEHNVTAYKVGKDTGISTTTLSEWKNGKYTPKMDKLQKIAKYFDVSVDYLLGNEKTPSDELTEDELSLYREMLKNREEVRKLFSLVANGTKEDVERAIAVLDALIKRG